VSVKQADLLEKSCHETNSEIILDVSQDYGAEGNPVKIISKSDGDYLRYETDSVTFTTKVKMPSKVTDHNGELIDDYTVAFKGSLGNFTAPSNEKKTYFVECKKPALNNNVFLYVIGLVLIIAAGLAVYFLFLRKKK
ncbi:MAG: hypothetical protein V1817_01655, partial [Candidatus Micrarchaeota archaeon]